MRRIGRGRAGSWTLPRSQVNFNKNGVFKEAEKSLEDGNYKTDAFGRKRWDMSSDEDDDDDSDSESGSEDSESEEPPPKKSKPAPSKKSKPAPPEKTAAKKTTGKRRSRTQFEAE